MRILFTDGTATIAVFDNEIDAKKSLQGITSLASGQTASSQGKAHFVNAEQPNERPKKYKY